MTTKPRPARGKRRPVSVNLVVWGSFAVGILGSLGFNIASTILTNGFSPSIAVAMLWPLLNLGAVEMMIRVPWPRGLAWTVARYGPTGLVAVISFVISYTHIHHVMSAMGEADISTMSGPFAIDFLMLLAGVALVALHTPKPPARRRKPAARKPRPRVAVQSA
ncbi:hypothetical protein [Amycolatopsis kentuckyensis]|uniref:hypothetical protein n=1 Tax=Amycolatopsis kentuckyensis TaxID=218823 RepID=UPI003569D3DF